MDYIDVEEKLVNYRKRVFDTATEAYNKMRLEEINKEIKKLQKEKAAILDKEKEDCFASLKKLSKQDREEIYKHAMLRSDEIVKGALNE